MIFIFLMAGSVYLSMYAAINLPCHPLLSALFAFIIYFVTASLSTIIAVFLSLLLGKSNQTHLKKISKYTIAEEGENHYYLEDGGAVPKNLIDTIVYDADRPYIEVRCYNIAHWKAAVFWELYEDRQEYILHSYTQENEL